MYILSKIVSAGLSGPCSDCILTGLPSVKELLYSVRNFGSEEGRFWSISSKIRKLVEVFFYQFMYEQSGTKQNLVAKIWPPNLVTICAWLPKLVANVSSNFHHLVNTGLAVGSFFKWLPITVAHTCRLDTIWVVYISPIGNGSIRLQSPSTNYALWNFTSSGAGHFSELAGAHT